MAKKLLSQALILLGATSIFVVFNGSSNGRGSEDRTGAPGSSGTCASCHGGNNNLNGQISLELLDKSTSTVVNEYIPGNTYTVTVKATGTSTKMGFQSTILNSSNQNIGSIANPSSGAALYTSGRNIAGHTAASSTGIWTYEWTAPSANQGVVTIYGVSVISNKNNSDNGDQVVTNKITINPAASNSLQAITKNEIRLYPNPSLGTLNFTKQVQSISVFDLNGKEILTANVDGNQYILPKLEGGIYLVKMKNDGGCSYQRILLHE